MDRKSGGVDMRLSEIQMIEDPQHTGPVIDMLYSSSVHEISNKDLGLAENSNINIHISVKEIDLGIDPDGYIVTRQMFSSDGTSPDGPPSDLWPGSTTRKLIFYKHNVTKLVCANNLITFTANAHNFAVGDYVTISNTFTRFNVSKKKVISVTANTFSFDGTGITPITERATTGKAIQDIIITGINSGRYYDFRINPYKGNPSLDENISKYSELISKYKTSYYSPIARDKISPASLANQTSGKSYLEIFNNIKNNTSIVYKDFDSIVVPAITYSQYYLALQQPNGYYSFGTTVYFDTEVNSNGRNSAGLGFFVSENGGKGYFIQLSTEANASDANKKPFRIIKVDGSEQRVLKDSQITRESMFAGVQQGITYAIDVKVKYTPSQTTIICFINGQRIVATDKVSNDKRFPGTIYPQKGVSLFTTVGKAFFDYVYADTITEEQYKKAEYSTNFYAGQFSNDILDLSFGDFIYNSVSEDDEITKKPGAVEEFGSTVREIYRLSTKFDERPAKPIDISLSLNKSAKILGNKTSAYGTDIFVLNNSSTTVPLEDSKTNSLFVFGNQINKTPDQEFSTVKENDYKSDEPIVFQSMWLQNENDVESLAYWIKDAVVNKGKILVAEVFGNPLLSPGDIVSVKYTYQGLDGTEKFIITGVYHTYKEGLTTEITCRSLGTQMV
jgi:hypothetical protein